MEWQLRLYTIKEGELEAWTDEWTRHVAPLRRRFGFRILGPWIELDRPTFVWLLGYDGEDGFDAADGRYYASEERGAISPDPARHIEAGEHRMLRDLAPARPRLFRVIVPVADIDVAASFYAALLGIEGERISPGRHYFDCDGTILACFDPRRDGDERDLPPNPDHVYVAVRDLDAAFRRAQAAGAELLEPIADRPWGERSFYVADPFGNKLCLVRAGTELTGA